MNQDEGEEVLEKCFSVDRPKRIYPEKGIRSNLEVYASENNPFIVWVEYEYYDEDEDMFVVGYVFCYLHLEKPEEYFLHKKLEPTMNKVQKNSNIF